MRLPLLPNGAALKLAQAEGLLGGKIWPSAVALCQYLASNDSATPREDTQCVELGSGTGSVGLYAAALGYPVILTEHRPPLSAVMTSVAYSVDGTPEELSDVKSDRLLKLLQTNVEANAHLFKKEQYPVVMELDWINNDTVSNVASITTKGRGFDLILASDVTYDSPLHQPLADTISGLLTRNSSTSANSKCLVSHQQRRTDLNGSDSHLKEFEKSLTKAGLTIVNQASHPVMEDTTTHKVSILDIQHL